MGEDSTKVRRGEQRDARRLALADVYGGAVDLHEIADRRGMTRLELVRWAMRPRASKAIEEMRRLSHVRAVLMLAGARAEAVRRLMDLAMDEGSAETARKACVDLLRLTGEERWVEPRAGSEEWEGGGGGAREVAALRRALERIAEVGEAGCGSGCGSGGEGAGS